MNAGAYEGKAGAYRSARPGYSNEAVEYIYEQLAPPDAVFVDIGAGTGKLTELLARRGNKIFAVELSEYMRGQLTETLLPFPNATVVDGRAEETTLPDHSVDVVISAQALNWFDIEAYRGECRRIGKPSSLVVTVYNYNPYQSHPVFTRFKKSSDYTRSTGALYKNPIIREFTNPVFFDRDRWNTYFTSMSGFPAESDPNYAALMAEINEMFDGDSADGVLRLDLVTVVYSERIGE